MTRKIDVRRIATVYLSAFFFVGCLSGVAFGYEREIEILASDMSEKIADSGKTKIAVVDLTNLRGDVTELGRFISEELSVSLAGAGKGFRIVDRTHLKSILQEHKLSATGLIDSAAARRCANQPRLYGPSGVKTINHYKGGVA